MFSRTRLRISFLHCEVWNSGELLRFMTSLNYLKRVVPPDLGLSVAVPFSYHNGASHENSKGSIELVEKCSQLHWISQWIHTFTLDSFKLSSIYN